MKPGEKIGLGAFVVNIFLFLLKMTAAVLSGSLAVLSSAFESLNDIIAYFLAYWSIKEAGKKPDHNHPFGHRRMEPIAGIVMAIFAGILAFEILRTAVINLISGTHEITITPYVFGVLIITVLAKIVMWIYFRIKAKKTMSSALDAMSIDSRNDVLSNFIVLIGIAGAYFGYLILDDLAAIFIAFYIAHSGYEVAKKNFDYMVGARPEERIIQEIKKKARLGGVKKLGKVRAHYVGDRVHVALNIVLDKNVTGPKSHNIAVRVQKAVESIQIVARAFVHVDYE